MYDRCVPTLDVLGHATWYTVQGAGAETVLLLHGGLSNSDAMLDSIGGPLGERRRVAAFDRRGHGRTADTPEAFHYESMVDETIAFIEHIGGPVHIVGWSDGGIVGLLLALRRPELVGRLVAIGTNYHWNVLPDLPGAAAADEGGVDETPEAESGDSGIVALMAAAYADRSPDGPDHFAVVAAKGFHLFGIEPELTAEDLARVSVPVLVMAGDDDLIPAEPHRCVLRRITRGPARDRAWSFTRTADRAPTGGRRSHRAIPGVRRPASDDDAQPARLSPGAAQRRPHRAPSAGGDARDREQGSYDRSPLTRQICRYACG